MQSAEVEIHEGLLLLGGELEGFGGRRQDGLQLGEVAVEVADVRGLLDRRQERRLQLLGQQRLPVDGLPGFTE